MAMISAPLATSRDQVPEDESEKAGFVDDTQPPKPPVRMLIFPMFCMFQAYTCYIVMQHFLKSQMMKNSTVDPEKFSNMFQLAATFMHVGKLVARLGHDVIFCCFSTYVRVYLAMVIALIGVLVAPISVYILGSSWLGIPFIHFFLIGVGVGIFEVTYLSVISELGENTKFWAILGCPLGIAWVDIFGLFCTSYQMPAVVIYWYIAVCIPIGMLLFWHYAPKQSGQLHQPRNFATALVDWRSWLSAMLPFFLAKVIGSFVMENTPGWFYVFNDYKVVPFWGPDSNILMSHDRYFCLVYIMVFLGDGISRRVPYLVTLTYKRFVLLLVMAIVSSIVGFLMEGFIIAFVTLFAAFVAFWGNGLGYALATKYIDRYVPKRHNRAVYSMWAMVGDVGGILGGLMINPFNAFFCSRGHYAHECVQNSLLQLLWK